jgi:acetate kinase
MTKESSMKLSNPRILTINGGSSSIKFALFEAGDALRRILEGGIERIGLAEDTLRAKGVCLKRQLKDKLIEHKQYIARHGQDMPEIRDWKWGNAK